MSSSAELAQAHEFYTAAAANRDADPETYEGARIRYFALKEGPGWLEQEKTRINDTKLQPAIDTYRQQFKTAQAQLAVQNDIIDQATTVRDRQALAIDSASNNFQFLQGLLEDKQAKMSAYDRLVSLTVPQAYIHDQTKGDAPISAPFVAYLASFPPSFTIVMNVVLGLLILFLVLILINKSRSLFTGWSNIQQSLFTRGVGSSPIIINTPMPSIPAK